MGKASPHTVFMTHGTFIEPHRSLSQILSPTLSWQFASFSDFPIPKK